MKGDNSDIYKNDVIYDHDQEINACLWYVKLSQDLDYFISFPIPWIDVPFDMFMTK